MRHSKTFRNFIIAVFFMFLLVPLACNWWGKNNNTSKIKVNVREPEKYQVTMLVSLDKGTNASGELPFATVKATRDGLSRRYDFKLDNSEIVYLEGVVPEDKSPSKNPEPFYFLIMPECKQYAEVRLDEMGIRIPSSLSPQDILSTLGQQQSVEVLGDEMLSGREVTKYRYVDEKTGEGIVFLDKLTGLPLKAKVAAFVLDPQADVGDPQGERRVLRVVIDIKDIAMTADSAQFQEPTGMTLVNPKEFCPQLNQVAANVTQFLWKSSVKGNATNTSAR